jgi:hypothetical protein
MKEKKKEKDLLEKTADEVMADIFHPNVAKHLRKHVEKHAKKIEEKQKGNK